MGLEPQIEKNCPAAFSHRASAVMVGIFIIPLLTAIGAGVPGCVTTTHVVGQYASPSAHAQTTITGSKVAAFSNDEPVSADQAVGTDPCEMRLQNIEAALLLYFSINRTLPPRLGDLVALSSGDLPLSCPVSHQDYLYIKDGLPIPGSPRRVIVCDATPAHLGKRWCIVLAPPIPGGAMELETQELPESVFRDYKPGN
jgi:hypothetical protein